MDKEHYVRKIQEELLAVLPFWNYHITKPFKQMLEDGVSLEMYYSLQTLRWIGEDATMSEFGKYTRMPKQQVTKMVNRLEEHHFVERIYDPGNRRIVRIRITDTALHYIDHILSQDARCFKELLEQMTWEECVAFEKALKAISDILVRMPIDAPSEPENAAEDLNL